MAKIASIVINIFVFATLRVVALKKWWFFGFGDYFMSFRLFVILVLSCFGIAPVIFLMSISSPAVLERLELAAQQESFARLQTEQYELNVRVVRLKERVSSLATLPGARDLIGYHGEQAIDAKKAGKRLTSLVNKWFALRKEVLEIRLLDPEGQERFLLTRNEQSGNFVPTKQNAKSDPQMLTFCKEGANLQVGIVRVLDIEVDHQVAAQDNSHVYGISLFTPVAVKDKVIGFLFCKVNMTDFLQDYAMSFWLDRAGNPLHEHEVSTADYHTHDNEASDDTAAEEFVGVKALLVDNKAFAWSGEDGRKVVWQPIIFNEYMPATLWVGHDVDRTELESWVEGQQFRVFLLVVTLVVIVILLAGKIGAFVDKRRAELLGGFDAIISGDRPEHLSWGWLREMRQMANELNVLKDRYFDMRHARQCAEEELRESNVRLEEIVERRTAELFATNEQLSEEVEERARAEEELIGHRDKLEELVRQRLVELAETNEQLQLEMVRRKHAQDSVRKNEARLRVILDSVPIGIFIVDREKKTITYANPASAGMIGAALPSDLYGEQCHAFFCGENRKNCQCLDEDVRFEQADITLKQMDGSPLSVLKTVIPLTIADRPCLLVSITDITELKRMSSQNQVLHEQLLQSQKMEAVGVLAGGVAHDFNNLLTIIQGSAELAMLASGEVRPESRYLAQIKETTERAGNLVRQLLLFSRTQPMTLSFLRLNDVVENLLKMLKRLIGEDVEIITELGEDIWPLEGNAANIEQVIMNLTVNGRDAMASGGKLYIRTSNVEFSKKGLPATVAEARPGRFVCLEVKDSGEGIAEETLKHIFEPFFTTKEAGKGTGLGLAVVYGIVKQHEGWIDIASEAGQGTSFKVYLPCRTTGAAEEVVASAAAVDLQGNGRRVLVVEDEEILRSLIADTLEHKGFTVFQAVNVAEALEVFEQEKGDFDLLFSDVVLPGEQNGIQLADVVREKRPGMPVILSSGYTDQKSQWAIIEERGFAFLQKPFNIGTLGRIVYDVIDKGEGE